MPSLLTPLPPSSGLLAINEALRLGKETVPLLRGKRVSTGDKDTWGLEPAGERATQAHVPAGRARLHHQPLMLRGTLGANVEISQAMLEIWVFMRPLLKFRALRFRKRPAGCKPSVSASELPLEELCHADGCPRSEERTDIFMPGSKAPAHSGLSL